VVKLERSARALAIVPGGGDQQADAGPQGGNVAQVVFGLGSAAGFEVRDQAEPQPLLVPYLVVAVQIAVGEDKVTAGRQDIIRPRAPPADDAALIWPEHRRQPGPQFIGRGLRRRVRGPHRPGCRCDAGQRLRLVQAGQEPR